MSDAQYKVASWMWVQDTTTATNMWGTIADWDVHLVADFSYSFSANRNQAGGSFQSNGNSEATKWGAGVDLSKWNTASLSSLQGTFYGASLMNADVSKWDVRRAKNMADTFRDAGRFLGTGLSTWSPRSSLTTLANTFNGAAKVVGNGGSTTDDISSWITDGVTTLVSTFFGASTMNADVSKWDVSKVTTMVNTFTSAAEFTGAGLNTWITTNLATLAGTFKSASKMNADVGGWAVTKVTSLDNTFRNAAKFTGTEEKRRETERK